MYDIILPTYNEKENIKPLFNMIQKVFNDIKRKYRIILIDDNSPDGTYEEACKYKNKINIELIKRSAKLGLGSAYKEALKHCQNEYIIIMDADLSHNPYDIKKMYKKIENKQNCDIVIGSRYMSVKGSGTYGWSLKRKIISRGANDLAQIVLGLKSSDATGSFRIYKRELFDWLVKQVKSVGYAYQIEILYLAEKNNYKIAECEIIFHERIYGSSKLGLYEIFYFVYILFYLRFLSGK
ncbi:hypothetical protein BDAP_002062 [Binucleata daphniae]